VKSLPLAIIESYRDLLQKTGLGAIHFVIEIEAKRETSPFFWSPFSGEPLEKLEAKLKRAIADIDVAAKAAYGIPDQKRATANNQMLVSTYTGVDSDLTRASAEVSYLLGVAFRRWDIRCATGTLEFLHPNDVFQEIPKIPPGKLVGENDVQTSLIFGIDGGDHCLIEKTRKILLTIYGDAAESREILLCSSLGFASIKDYLNSSIGFFGDHLKRYSRSGRKAPIYWPLSTTSGSYALWLYYPSLNSQTLYTVINDFVEPKLKQVVDNVAVLRNEGSARSRDDEKQFETLQTFELELIEFRDTLLKIAQDYHPNHDDGVQITAAPLWPLFRHKPWQKVLKDTWAKLEKGDYDWAHLAMNYWPNRVREKCKTDKSLAIAHGMEEHYVEPEAKSKKVRGKKSKTSSESNF